MRTLRFSAFFVVGMFCSAAWAQNSQAAPVQQPAAAQVPEKNQSEQQLPDSTQPPSAPSSTGQNQQPVGTQEQKDFKLKLLPPLSEPKQKKFPTGTVDRGFRASIENDEPRTGLRTIQKNPDDFETGNLQGNVDPGIRIDIAGANMCAAIVSYNFSRSAPGEMPKLESVTTCTPANKAVPLRTRHKEANPKTPALMQTVLAQ